MQDNIGRTSYSRSGAFFPLSNKGKHGRNNNERSYPNYPLEGSASDLSALVLAENIAERRIVGLKNFGNTCYCNAPLQVLFGATKFCQWFISHVSSTHILNPLSKYKGALLKAWLSILKEVFAEDSSQSVLTSHIKLLQIIRSRHPQLEEDQQCDAHEFLRSFLDGLSTECNRVTKPHAMKRQFYAGYKAESVTNLDLKAAGERFWHEQLGREHSIVTDCFGGLLVSEISCLKCNSARYSFDFYLDVSLDTLGDEEYVYLEDLLRAEYLNRSELMSLDCPKCKVRATSSVRTSICMLPSDYLVIHIKRFRWDHARESLRRVDARLFLPEDGLIDMGPYCHLSDHPSTKNAIFKLNGVVSHFGTANSGHYVCEAQVDGKWHCFSDETIHPSFRPQLDATGVYILFLQRVSAPPGAHAAPATVAMRITSLPVAPKQPRCDRRSIEATRNCDVSSSISPTTRESFSSKFRKDVSTTLNRNESDAPSSQIVTGKSAIQSLKEVQYYSSESFNPIREGSLCEPSASEDENEREHLQRVARIGSKETRTAESGGDRRVCRLTDAPGSPTEKPRSIFQKASEKFMKKPINPIVATPKKTLSIFNFMRDSCASEEEPLKADGCTSQDSSRLNSEIDLKGLSARSSCDKSRQPVTLHTLSSINDVPYPTSIDPCLALRERNWSTDNSTNEQHYPHLFPHYPHNRPNENAYSTALHTMENVDHFFSAESSCDGEFERKDQSFSPSTLLKARETQGNPTDPFSLWYCTDAREEKLLQMENRKLQKEPSSKNRFALRVPGKDVVHPSALCFSASLRCTPSLQ